ALGERGWRVLQERFEAGESFDGEVSGYNKGGLLVNVDGVNAFVPMSQIVGVRPARDRDDGSNGNTLGDQVGRQLRLKVIEINRRRNRVILSERAALQEWRSEQKERLIEELREGDIRRGRISSVRSFGVFVDLGGADGLAHLSELTWERGKTPNDLFNVGDEVDVYVTKVDPENKKIALSLRRANPAQWDAIVEKYDEGRVVPALVTKLVAFGAFARVEGPVEGLIHVSELVDRRIGHPKEVVREGDLLPVKIVRIERDRHRLGLSLRRARDEGELMGFVFSDGGEVLSIPDDVRSEFEAREGPLPEPREADDDDEPRGSYEGDAPSAETATIDAPTTDGIVSSEAPATDGVVTSEAPATDGVVTSEMPAATDEESAAEVVAEAPLAEEAPAPESVAEAPHAEEAPAPESVAEAPLAEEEPTAEAPVAEEAPEQDVTTEEAPPLETAEAPAADETTPGEPVAAEEPEKIIAEAAGDASDDNTAAEALTTDEEHSEEPIGPDSPATPQD
ncbi:MAG: S1 RNA-binding domain-containing protein, partial [Dehalococcoidia bacterium]